MKMRIPSSIIVSLLGFGLLTLTAFRVQADTRTPARDDLTVLKEDYTLLQAMRKGDKAAAALLLDDRVSWIDRAGKKQNKSEVLEHLTASSYDSSLDVTISNYGELAVVRGLLQKPSQNIGVRFMRVWVKQSDGWRVFAYHETSFPSSLGGLTMEPAAHNDVPGSRECDNPCKSIPYNPTTEGQKGIIASWQKMEVAAVVKHDSSAWASTVIDGYKRVDRIEQIDGDKRENAVMPVEPVDWTEVSVFGNAGVMVMLQPVGGKPIYWTRVWVKQPDGVWRMAFSYSTLILRDPTATSNASPNK